MTILLFHSARSVLVQRPLITCPAPCSLMCLPAVHWISACGTVLHLNQGNLWPHGKIAAFPSKVFLPAASGSPEMRLPHSISLCIPPPVLTQQIVCMLAPFIFFAVLIPPVFLVSFARLFPLHHPALLAQAPLPIAATMSDH